jgi:polyhydroxyalkanoate synthesis regulator phasin
MSRKTLLAGGALTASVFVGGVAGALLFTPQLSSAQVNTTSAVGAADAPPWAMARGAGGPDVVATAATALGMSQADLKTALQGGKTIAQVAKDKGVDVQKVIDALVAQGKARLQQAEADLPARMTDLVNGTLGVRAGGDHGGRRSMGADLGAAATALGMSEADLQTALRGGKTMAEVAKDKGVDVQKVIDAVVAAQSAQLDQAVTDGKLTPAQATARKADLKARVTALVNGERPAGGPGFRHGPRG